MFRTPKLDRWGIFYGDRDAQIANQFKNAIAQTFENVSFETKEPAMHQVKYAMKSEAWIKEL